MYVYVVGQYNYLVNIGHCGKYVTSKVFIFDPPAQEHDVKLVANTADANHAEFLVNVISIPVYRMI